MNPRPRLNPELDSTDKAVEFLGWAALLALWAYVLASYAKLPAIIPVHFSGSGQVDGLGSKSWLLALPGMVTVLFIGLYFLSRVPYLFNYPVAITDANALGQYTNATRMLRWLKLMLVLAFMLVSREIIRTAQGLDSMGKWLLPVILLLVMVPLAHFLVKTFRMRG